MFQETPDNSLAQIATLHPNASRVFQRYGLDFCCQGDRSLATACETKQLDPRQVLDEIFAAAQETRNWKTSTLEELVHHVIARFHRPAQEEIPLLIKMAKRVETRHGYRSDCPLGLHSLLQKFGDELLLHMQKEEAVLFPLFQRGLGFAARPPVEVMESEHLSHGENLKELRRLTNDYAPPSDSCSTWRSLYLRLYEFERELMEHIAFEHELLFPRGLEGQL